MTTQVCVCVCVCEGERLKQRWDCVISASWYHGEFKFTVKEGETKGEEKKDRDVTIKANSRQNRERE